MPFLSNWPLLKRLSLAPFRRSLTTPTSASPIDDLQVSRLGFYSKGSIHPLVPKILAAHDEVEMAKDRYEGELGALVNRLLKEEKRPENGMFKVLMLSAPNSTETLRLVRPIPNDKLSKTGKTTAFTMGQRYVASERQKQARTTSDLD